MVFHEGSPCGRVPRRAAEEPTTLTKKIVPEKNRVTPTGHLEYTPDKMAWMGNRGALKRPDSWSTDGWILCRLKIPGRQNVPFQLKYTRLFFLDEATGFSAGHRPCYQCRKRRAQEFRSAWCEANVRESVTFPAIDAALKAERVLSGSRARVDEAVASLPNGVILEASRVYWLKWRDLFFPWSFAGYGEPKELSEMPTLARVVTPPSIVRMYTNGFTPQVHPSAFG